MQDDNEPWVMGAIWLNEFPFDETHEIVHNFPEFWNILQDVEMQIFSMQIGLD